MRSPIVAGLISAIPLAAILMLYVLVRGKVLVKFFQEQDESIAKIPQKTLFWIVLAGFLGASILFGALSGLVYGWLGMPNFQYLAFGATPLFSILAIVSRQPLTGDKIAWNLAVGLVLGLLVPLLSAQSI